MNEIENKCKIHDCCFTLYSNGYCKRHYVKHYADFQRSKKEKIKNCKISHTHNEVYTRGFCILEGCDKKIIKDSFFCEKHSKLYE